MASWRVCLELRLHRVWLHRFLATSGAPCRLTPGLLQHHSRWSKDTNSFRNATTSALRKRKIRPERPVESTTANEEVPPRDDNPSLAALRSALVEEDIEASIETYLSLSSPSDLARGDVLALALCLHESLRREQRKPKGEIRREDSELRVTFAERLVNDIKKGQVPADRRAIMHLLSIFKESGARDSGISFWKWLEQQDDEHVDADVYGAAIELLAVEGVPLADLEAMYERALQRFPGNFNAYHLSNEAIVPDRDQPINVHGISMVLLEGIVFARLIRGASQKAYMGLDTALRLFPILTPRRLFEMFVNERPPVEAYTVVAIACRGGVGLDLRKFMTALRNSAGLGSVVDQIHGLRAMLSTLYMYYRAGGMARSNVVNEIVIAFSQILRARKIRDMEDQERRLVVDAVLGVIRKALEVFARHGTRPGIAAFNSIITNVGGFGRQKEVVGIAMRDMKALGLGPTNVTWRSILSAAAANHDKELIAEAWKSLVRARAAGGQQADLTDLHVLISACTACGAKDLAQEAIEIAKSTVNEQELAGLSARVEDIDVNAAAATVEKTTESALPASTVLAEINKLQADLAVLEERMKIGRKEGKQDFPMTLMTLPNQSPLPEREMLKLYDEITTEAAIDQPPRSAEVSAVDGIKPKPPAMSTTGVPFGKLRYENWKTMNYLLALSHRNDTAYHKSVDEAIAAGVSPPPRDLGWGSGSAGELGHFGLSDETAEEGVEESSEVDTSAIAKGREEILRLRGRLREGV